MLANEDFRFEQQIERRVRNFVKR